MSQCVTADGAGNWRVCDSVLVNEAEFTWAVTSITWGKSSSVPWGWSRFRQRGIIEFFCWSELKVCVCGPATCYYSEPASVSWTKMWWNLRRIDERQVPFRLDAVLQAACVAVLLIHNQDVHISSWSFEHTGMESSPADTRGLGKNTKSGF